jgi:hypothetical protein
LPAEATVFSRGATLPFFGRAALRRAEGIVFMVNGRGRVSPTIGLQPQNEMGKPGDGVFIRRLTWLCTRVTLDSL